MLTLAQLADYLDGVWHGNANHAIFSLSSLSRATSRDVAYFDNLLLQESLESTAAGVVLLKSEHKPLCPVNAIVVSNPLIAMNEAAKYLAIAQKNSSGIHPTAQIHQSVQLGQGVSIGANTVINEQVQLDDGVCIGSNTVVESDVRIGRGSQIGHGVMIYSGSQVGQNVVLSDGCIIGASPFNYLKHHGTWQQGPAVGGVIISNKVHIGANTVIDRGSFSDTYLAEGVCIDNLVQIAHDVIIGANTAIAGCAAIGAHALIGSDCIIGGASCIAANVRLSNDVVITGMSTVSKSIAKAGIYSSGTLVHEHQRWRRNAARFRRLDDYITKLGALEKKIESS
ncbi:UDP-3-O-(3-hydroxymyristoyl)glucosamine N-acyltransferase [Legionella maioricensis]|uniref:UDP-3-O-(3-hydroxymyristoyl)glucosamine N-acyltransferase n=1 Tax=Legionella maioricensis TaxID=2896528 RepID=A0A9X2D021_9GAMM|nr:UDP-3-O-(3-hydroxymyristoyl)glucosamine N-acyltransferase [Legionella maioricensis]MCL9683367.1 UDP-3-O-(3-hydroxymyristoyl)glucosamine N-acyltransferase [Legionella maioricensis]MCL9685937.1 UDP-3-O-(3-hydroxymyristoyl)glucosamine N-acyltransferase [Legionella maioricensis]